MPRHPTLTLADVVFSLGFHLAKADSLTFSSHGTQRNYSDEVYWSQLPRNSAMSCGTTIDSPTKEIPLTISFGRGTAGTAFAQCGSGCGAGQNWAGDYLQGQHILGAISSSYTNNGNLILPFRQRIDGIGFVVEADYFGPFTADVTLFEGSTDPLSGKYRKLPRYEDLTGADITSVRVAALTVEAPAWRDSQSASFCCGRARTSTPEPASLMLLGSSVIALGLPQRRLPRQS